MHYSFQQYVEEPDHAFEADKILISRTSNFQMDNSKPRMLSVATANLQTVPVSLFHVRSTGHVIDVVADDFLTVMLPTAGTVQVSAGDDLYRADDDGSLSFLPSSRKTAVIPASRSQFAALMLKLAVSDLRSFGITLSRRKTAPYLQTASTVIASLRDLLSYTFSGLHSHVSITQRPRALRGLEVLIEEHIRCLFPVDDADLRLNINQAKLAAAEDFMRAYYDNPISIKDIARFLGISLRSMQTLFRLNTGKTPHQRLSEIRLEEARCRLLVGDGHSVTDIALDCGFSHLGRFSQVYQLIYGEKPSETLRRNSGRSRKH